MSWDDLSPLYLDHLAAPRNHGDLVAADAAGEAGSVVSGMGVRVTLAWRPEPDAGAGAPPPRAIERAAFRALASPAPRAPGSVLVTRLEGMPLPDAGAVTAEAVLDSLGGAVPDAVARGAGLLVEALRAALDDRGPDARANARADAPGVLVCRCLSVGDRRIRRAIRRGARDVKAIGADCHAGQGCHSCWPDLRMILDEELADDGRAPTHADPRLRAVDAIVRPLWRGLGVRLDGVEIAGGVVRLGVGDISPGALASPIGAIATARYALREALGDDVRVEPADDPARLPRGP